MAHEQVTKLVEGTADVAFGVDAGLIVCWNLAAEALFGVPARKAIGRPCSEIVQGSDECGPVCCRNCVVTQAVNSGRPTGNFDLLMNTALGRRWCNVSVLMCDGGTRSRRCALHLVRAIDMSKRLEILLRDFSSSNRPAVARAPGAPVSPTQVAAGGVVLTGRELEVLRLLGKGGTSTGVAAQLHISRTTVNNHIQHILKKFQAHTRLSAIRRAELAGLL